MSGQGVQRGLSAMLETAPHVTLGTVSALTSDPAVGWWAEVETQPGGATILARVVWAGTTAQGGDFWPITVGDEVLVVYPDGDPNGAVVIAGLTSAPVATTYANAAPELVHPAGKAFRTSTATTAAPVVTQALLPDLAASLTELLALFGALAGLGITLPSTSTIQLVTSLSTLYRSRGVTSD